MLRIKDLDPKIEEAKDSPVVAQASKSITDTLVQSLGQLIKNHSDILLDFIENKNISARHKLNDILVWYFEHQKMIDSIKPNGVTVLFVARLADALTLLAETMRTSGNDDDKHEATDIMHAAEDCLDTIPPLTMLSSKVPGRIHLHAAFKRLAAEMQKRYTATSKPEVAENLRVATGHYLFQTLRTQANVEPFDHLVFIGIYQLHYIGLCNALTSEALRFYGKNKSRTESFIEKLERKTVQPTRPHSFIQRMKVLQDHNVSSMDERRTNGLPSFTTCLKASGKENSIEILTDLGANGQLKHSMLVHFSRNKQREITDMHIFDSTFGEAHFSFNPAGIEQFDHTMQLLKKGYAFMYGSISYVLVNKNQLLMRNNTLLFRSSPEAPAPDMTFKNKVQKKP